jgi:aspartate/methionine/tyrosine aminotransferase
MTLRQFEARNQHFDRMVNTPDLRWLGQNTNHYPAHASVREAMIKSIEDEEFHLYAPPAGLEELRELVLLDLGLGELATFISDGAVAGLYHVCHTLLAPGDQLVTTDPTWNWPMAFARSVGADVVQIPIYGDEFAYRLDPERLRAAVTEKTKIIYLVDPNNPLGTVCRAEEIKAIVDIARSSGAYLIHDCTYRDFAYEHHLAAALYPERTITAWSFSKWLGLAGMRVGALVANPDIMERLATSPPNNLGSSIVAQRGAVAGLKIKQDWFPGIVASQRAHQEMVRDAVEKIDGFRVPVFPSNGNFLIVECEQAGVRPEAICVAMAKAGILVRQGSYHTKTFGDRFIKVSVSVPLQWVEQFCEAFPGAVEEARKTNEAVELF